MAYLNIAQASRHIGKTEKTLRRWVHSGKIPYRVENGKLYFEVSDLDAMRDKNIPAADNEALLARIETLEQRVAELEHQVQKQPAVLRPAAARYETGKPAPARPRPTRLVHDGGQLPDGLISFRSMAKAHNIAESTAQRAIESGRLDIVRGHWKQGRAIVQQALDQAGQRHFYELFETNPGFRACDACPH